MARFLALDWDHLQLHVVAATISGTTVRIQRAALWPEQQSPNPIEAEALGQLLRERLKSVGIAPAPVLAVIGRDRVILKEVRHPKVSESEEAGIVRFQAVKELTDPPEEVVLDYTPVGPTGNGTEQKALALAVRKEMLITYQGICKGAGLKLLALTPRPFATLAGLRRLIGTSVLTPPPASLDGAIAILTMNERQAEFCIVRGEVLVYARNLNLGQGLAGEIKRNLAVYNGQNPQTPAQALYIAGVSEQASLRERLQEMSGIPVHAFDPFGGLENAHLPTINRGAFAGAVGMLYAQADKKPLAINFVKPREPRPPANPNKRRALLGVGLAAAILIAVTSWCFIELARKDREIDALYLEKKSLDTQLTALEDDSKRLAAIDTWNNAGVIWLDELYDLTDRFPNIENIKLVSLVGDPLLRSAKDKEKHVAKLTLKGITTEDFQSIDTLVARLVEDGHYRVEPKQMGRNTGLERGRFSQQFTTKVDIEKQPPNRYIRRLPEPPTEDEQRAQERDGRRRRPTGGNGTMTFPGGRQ